MAGVADLFTVSPSRVLLGFTTSNISNSPLISAVPLTDKTLGVHKVASTTTHNLVRPPIPIDQDEAHINPGNKIVPAGGFGFYLRGPPDFAQALNDPATGAVEVIFGYDVLFEEGFDFREGGKLPGIYGGAGDAAYGCTGGRQTDRCKCFNLRLMWRENGVGELYAYVPQSEVNTRRLLAVPPRSIQHPDYGFSVGRGAWTFASGRWTRVTERVKINDVGQENGEIEILIDGKSVFLAQGLVLRTPEGPDAHVQGLHFQTFFGGHSPDWASPKDQRAWFANVSGAIIKSQAGVANPRDEL
ncbi:hypothetical protein TRAPUB_11284 [Trametes pubescens]|uniref:Polysaccharide lyase 14 domain-containing protein n=1 Tax=Trametes pubescens TaxID=154538 RepID=A0A1M2VX35_TRAPU|nr:hypothetical protein TRAPUB_11284 [Trametes pubescens]